MKDAANEVRRWLLVVCHFVCPILFFTNLTRNPYITQITMLHAALPLALAAWAWSASRRPEGWRLPRLPVALPLAVFLAAWGLSWVRAYFGHPPFYKPSIIAEGARATVFLLAICLTAFTLAAAAASEDDGTSDVPLGGWAAFALGWGLLWLAFPQLRARMPARADALWPLIWDPYGACLWVFGLAAVGWLTRRGRAIDWIYLALCAGFLASAYGVLQYFNVELVWPYTLNPYGGRAVSTFGNPNFLSSYDVIMMPVALGLFLVERAPARRAVYAVVFLTLEAALLATLTRSSWAGALVGCGALFFSPPLRARLREEPRRIGLLATAAAALVLLWPSSAIGSGYTPTVIGRLSEVSTVLGRGETYSPLYQRVLIWSCAWLMGSEAPLLGKGGGLLELFYPFYQGHMLHEFNFFHGLRTHANNAHNEILEIFSQTGILGLGAFVAVWVVFFLVARRWAKTRAGEDPVWAGAVAGCAGMLTDNMLNVSLHFAVPAFLFWWMAGTAMGCGARGESGSVEWRGPLALRRAAALGVLLAALGAAWLQIRIWEREAWYFAGFKLVRQGNLPAAQRILERSRSWGPREVNALYELGNVYARSARPGDAADAYRQALNANAGYDEIYFNLATVDAVHLGRQDEARVFYETAFSINPLSNELYNSLSAFYLRDPARYSDRALELLRTATRMFPNNPNHWNNLGYALALKRQWQEAEDAYTRALSIAPDMPLAERNLLALAAQAGRPRAAILAALGDLRTLDAAISRQDYSDRTLATAAAVTRRAPRLARGRFVFGSLLLARGRPAEAVAELEAAVSLDPARAPAHLNLGSAYLAQGKAAQAEAQFRQALSLEPGNPAAMERLKSLGVQP